MWCVNVCVWEREIVYVSVHSTYLKFNILTYRPNCVSYSFLCAYTYTQTHAITRVRIHTRTQMRRNIFGSFRFCSSVPSCFIPFLANVSLSALLYHFLFLFFLLWDYLEHIAEIYKPIHFHGLLSHTLCLFAFLILVTDFVWFSCYECENKITALSILKYTRWRRSTSLVIRTSLEMYES